MLIAPVYADTRKESQAFEVPRLIVVQDQDAHLNGLRNKLEHLANSMPNNEKILLVIRLSTTSFAEKLSSTTLNFGQFAFLTVCEETFSQRSNFRSSQNREELQKIESKVVFS